MMDDTQRPNYFELLELDPDSKWSDSRFEAQLNQKQAEWTRGRNHPRHALRYKSYLDMVGDIQAVMTNPVRREAEQQDARQRLTQQRHAARQRFQDELALRAARGYLTRQEVDVLRGEYAAALGQKAFDTAIAGTGVDIHDSDTPATGAAPAVLDASTMRLIAANLEITGKDDLYDFLGMVRATRTADLLERARMIYAENQRQANKTAQITAGSDLAGQAMKVFSDDANRQRYDHALAEQDYADLLADVQRITQGDRTLHAGQYDLLLDRAAARHLDTARAADIIQRRARELNIALILRDGPPTLPGERCPSCGTSVTPEAVHCPACGTTLQAPCPHCGTTNASTADFCIQCGAVLANLPNIEAMLREAREHVAAGRYDRAFALVQLARRQWTDHLPASHSQQDPVSRAIAELEDRTRQEQTVRADTLGKLQKLLDERHFYAARVTLREVEAELPTLDLTAQREQIERAIEQAETDLRRARAAEARGDDVIALYRRILRHCQDCRPAREALARTPPPPPGPLTVRAGKRTARLRWEPAPEPQVYYTVVRKYGARSVGPADGEMLVTVAGTTFDDPDPAVGLPVFYSVYTNRDSVLSVEGVQTDEPLFFIAGVADFSGQVDDGLVRLRWQAPANTAAVIVRRGKDAPPTTPNEGENVRVFGLNDAVDSGLTNGQPYHYSAFAAFTDHNGDRITSAGVSLTAIPAVPPRPIEGLTITSTRERNTYTIQATWPPPDKGEAALLYGEKAPALRPGHAVRPDVLANLGTLLPAPTNEATVQMEGTGILYLTPLVLFQDMAYVGQGQVFTALEDVRNLRAESTPQAIRLTWEWPPNCQHALVAYHDARYPTPDDPDAVMLPVTRAEYDLHGGYEIDYPLPRDHFITVYAVIMRDGERLIAPGTEATCRQRVSLSSRITLRYRLNAPRRRLRGGSPQIILEAQGRGDLPELVIVQKHDAPPTRRTDGQVVARIPTQLLDSDHTVITVDLDGLSAPPEHVRLFPVEDTAYSTQGGHLRIYHPAPDAPPPVTVTASTARTCPHCFNRYTAEEAQYRCTNSRCRGRTEDKIYADYEGLPTPERMGLAFTAPQEGRNGLRLWGKQRTGADCPACGQTTYHHVCPHCHHDVLYDSTTQEQTIAVIGGRGTGKSNYIAALVYALEHSIGAGFDAGIRALGDRTRERFERDFYAPLFRQHRVIPPTPTAAVDAATRTPLAFRITFKDGGTANLVLFDTAGEDMQALDTMSTEARYILHADGLIFLLDPLQLPVVRQRLDGVPLPPPDPGAEPEYIIERLYDLFGRHYGLDGQTPIRVPVAFTLSKVDLLTPLLEAGSGLRSNGEHFGAVNMADIDSVHAEIGSYLHDWSGSRLPALVRSHFASYRYLGVSSFGRPPRPRSDGTQTVETLSPIRVEDPLLWLFSQFGLVKNQS